MEDFRAHAALRLLVDSVVYASDSNVLVGFKKPICRFELPKAEPGFEPISSAAGTQRHVLQGGCHYTCQATATSMLAQPINRNRWRQSRQT
jgi:hypothetical protein